MALSKTINNDWSIVAAEKFVQATRDSGYSNTASAVSELVDNALQAGARRIDIDVSDSGAADDIKISVTDNGCGMDLFTLRQALRFGGSSRFNDRSGLGRFGMGLPNSSLSQARRVTVSSWQDVRVSQRAKSNIIGPGFALQTYLDVDEIADGRMTEVPRPRKPKTPLSRSLGRSGTIVQWTQCDRLQFKRPSTICRHLNRDLSQRFRYFLQHGVKIRINETLIAPFDPLFLMNKKIQDEATPFGNEMEYAVSANPDQPDAPVGIVKVRFVELPVSNWANLSSAEKRAMGIVGRSGASIVRAGREVDYGWYFFGSKRRENYDDWWRCEIRFEPVLDDAFGLTHTKQQIRPQQFLVDCLVPDLEVTARTLSARARVAHAKLNAPIVPVSSERIAAQRSQYLRPLPSQRGGAAKTGKARYSIVHKPLENGCFYSVQRVGRELQLVLDPEHAFFREVYGPFLDCHDTATGAFREKLELLLFAAARAELSVNKVNTQAVEQFRSAWSNTLEAFIGG